MTRRRRLLLLILALLIAIPVLAVVGVGSYLRSGGLEREIEQAWSDYGLPGRLRVGTARFTGLGEAVAEEVSIAEDGQPALATVRRMQVRFDAFDRRLLALRIDGVRGGLDARRYRFLHAIIEAEHRHPPTRAPKPVRVEVVDAAVELPGGLLLSEAAVQVDALGPRARVEATARLGGRPLRVQVATDRASPDAPVVTTVTLVETVASPAALVAVAEGMGLIGAPPAELVAWLPPLADFSGSVVAIDPVSDTFRGPLTAAWEGGEAACDLAADPRRINLLRLRLRDARLGSAEGSLTAERSGASLMVDASPWQAGPGLPVPAGLPFADMARLLPTLQVRWPTTDRRTALALVGPGRSRLELTLGGGAPPRLTATEIPLVMAQGLMPAPLVLGGGHVVEARAVLVPDRPEFSAEVRQARLLAEGWSFGPLDGLVAVVVSPGGDVRVSADLPKAETPRGRPPIRLVFAGNARRGQVAVECDKVEGLLGRLRGPLNLPDLAGSLALEAGFAFADGAAQIEVKRLELGQAMLRLAGRDFVDEATARLSGTVRADGRQIAVDLGGQLQGGRLRIPGQWLPLAAQTPLFSIEVTVRLAEGRFTGLALQRAMVRAATTAGEPLPGGYSAQFDGSLDAQLAGRATGVVDHADLGWLAAVLIPGQVQVAGEGAAAFQAELIGGEVKRIDGAFMPLGADLDIDRGALRVGGITGSLRFTIGGEKKP